MTAVARGLAENVVIPTTGRNGKVATIGDAGREAQNYIRDHGDVVELQLGAANSSRFLEILKSKFEQALEGWDSDYKNKIRELWLVVGSGLLLCALKVLLPHTELHIVQVGKGVYYEDLEREDAAPKSHVYVYSKLSDYYAKTGDGENKAKLEKRVHLHELPEPIEFYDHSEDAPTPPYPSVPSYDAKVYDLFMRSREDGARVGGKGAYIWNAASDSLPPMV